MTLNNIIITMSLNRVTTARTKAGSLEGTEAQIRIHAETQEVLFQIL